MDWKIMGKIFILMGKSASGKDSIFAKLRKEFPRFQTIIPYTTRPKREDETDGENYHFTDIATLNRYRKEGKLVEMRTYHTVLGDWYYATVNDENMDLGSSHYFVIGTLESYLNMREYFKEDAVVPLYLEVEEGTRLTRALEREKRQSHPKYAEMCRRFLADEEDFSEEKLAAAKISLRFQNENMEDCVREIIKEINAKTQ